MKTERIADRVPSVTPLGCAQLDHYRLVMNKRGRDGSAKANIEVARDEAVFGVVFALDTDDWTTLDAFERGYTRREIEVTVAEDRRVVTTYCCEDPTFLTREPIAYDWYVELMRDGAKQHGLPAWYRERLAGLPSQPDPDDRVEKRR